MRPWVILILFLTVVALAASSCVVPDVEVGYGRDHERDPVRRRSGD